jgi:hypothetical protein
MSVWCEKRFNHHLALRAGSPDYKDEFRGRHIVGIWLVEEDEKIGWIV